MDGQNRLLAHLSGHALGAHLTRITPSFGQTMIHQGEPLRHGYFPLHGAVVSLTRAVEDGTLVEVGLVGHEGFAGVAAVLDPRRHLDTGVLQAQGPLMQVPIDVVREEFGRNAEFREALMRYVNAFLMQIAQTAVCNRLHPLEQRLARWILMMHDRAGTDELRMTQEFLAAMLGVRLAGVNEAVQSLERSALIRHSRGLVTVVDRAGLEAASCECYAVIHREFERVFER